MNAFRNRTLEAVARFQMNLALHSPAEQTREALFRSNLYHALTQMPSSEGNAFYKLLFGLEYLPLSAALMSDAPQPEIKYPTTALSDTGLPIGATLDGGKEWALVQIFGEVAFQNMESQLSIIQRSKRVDLRINSGGGDTRTALKFADAMTGRDVEATVYRKAISSAATILQAATRRKIYADGVVMVHESRAASFGTAAELRTQADELDSVREKVKALYHRSPAYLVDKWFHSGDHWFTAPEALAVGLVDEIIPTPETPQQIFPDQTPVVAPVETDVDADAVKLATELLFRLRGTFTNKTRFNELLGKFQ